MAIIGIDLGTTNSLVVTYKDDHVVMIPNVYGEFLTPSIVSINIDNSVIVGKVAKERLVTHPQDTTSLFKRNMGTKQKVYLKNHEYLPEELSAFVVKQLLDDAKRYLKEEIDEIVISVPAYFNDAQRNATKRIGKLLGVKVERLVNEPSAASMACHDGNKEDEAFVVFDFGGGTLDVSIVDCFDNVVSICSIAGNNHLGGSDFDKLIALDFCKKNQINFEKLTKEKQESLISKAERAKIALQDNEYVDMHIHLDDKEYAYELSNPLLIELGKAIFEKMKKVLADAINNSCYKKEEIDKIIMVGGSCHMPIVFDFLYSLMNIEVSKDIEKDYTVAKGLGIYVGIKQRVTSIKDLVLTDICPFSLSTSVHNENEPERPLADILIPRNSVLPSSVTKLYSTRDENQRIVKIEVFQGEGIYTDQNSLLTTHEVDLPKERKIEKIAITFTYDINALLVAEVVVLSTGKKTLINIGGVDISKERYEAIKQASMKLSLEPQVEYIDEQVSRLMMEQPPYIQEWLKMVYLDFRAIMNEHKNNLRRRGILLKRMEKIIMDMNIEVNHCELFNIPVEDELENDEVLLS